VFRIHGRDALSVLTQGVILLSPVAIVVATAWALGSGALSTPWADDAAEVTAIVVLCVLASGAMLAAILVMTQLLSSGRWARYLVRIDREVRKVTAYDRRRGRVLWESAYEPSHLHLAQTRIHKRYRSVLRPALVYGDSCADLVDYDVPTPYQTMLTVGTREELEGLMLGLGRAEPEPVTPNQAA
jgi:hypothetical protein